MLALFQRPEWQMTYGERVALEGVVSSAKPALAIEIGTAGGGSLASIAAHSREVHSFDLAHDPGAEWPANVTLHTGDSHVLLPRFLADLEQRGANVDFVLVDGDHTRDGLRQDLDDLLASPALERTLVIVHDTINGAVRRGVEDTRLGDIGHVAYFDLDFVPGRVTRSGAYRGQSWGGLGLVVIDRSLDLRGALADGERFFSSERLIAPVRRLLAAEGAVRRLARR